MVFSTMLAETAGVAAAQLPDAAAMGGAAHDAVAHADLRAGSLPEGPRPGIPLQGSPGLYERGLSALIEPVPAKPDAPAFASRVFAAAFLQVFAPASGRHDLM
jgi:hypothetical protein